LDIKIISNKCLLKKVPNKNYFFQVPEMFLTDSELFVLGRRIPHSQARLGSALNGKRFLKVKSTGTKDEETVTET
jgi:hypothetical protein